MTLIMISNVEIWKDVKGYEGLYQVSNLGKIESLTRIVTNKINVTRVFKGQAMLLIKSKGYLVLSVSKNGNQKVKKAHRLVAQAFIHNPDSKCCVNHKDGNKLNNNVNNLEWVTPKENNDHAYKTGLKNCNHLKKKVVMLSLNGNVIRVFESNKEAGITMGIHLGDISGCCLGKRKTAGGYKWEYYKKENENG